jgi:hypothetical protein
MTTAGHFITELQNERRRGNISAETEQHLRHEFRKLGPVTEKTRARAIGAEAQRLEREARTLRRMQVEFFGTVVDSEPKGSMSAALKPSLPK